MLIVVLEVTAGGLNEACPPQATGISNTRSRIRFILLPRLQACTEQKESALLLYSSGRFAFPLHPRS